MRCLFASDLHGHPERYGTLLAVTREEQPSAVFLGGDLLPSGMHAATSALGGQDEFVSGFLVPALTKLRADLGESYPRFLVILGNDDARSAEVPVQAMAEAGLVEYIHGRRVELGRFSVYGYAFVPPTPFLLKDWERYDVSRFVDPGCVSPEEGFRTVPVIAHETRYSTISRDLAALADPDHDLGLSVFLFHAPPHRTLLDRAALDGEVVDSAPVDVHVGSIAIRRFIEARQPLLTLHGHVHESARMTGAWRDHIGRTVMLSAAHDGPELALVRFDLDELDQAERDLL